MTHDYRLLRSWLFVPGDAERKLAKAWTAGADALIVDLEDAVAGERKAIARDIAAGAIAAALRGKIVVAIRINAIDTGLAEDDMARTFRCRPDAYVLPKVIDAAEIRRVSDLLAGLEAQAGMPVGSTAIVPIVTEHPRAIPRLESLCDADPRVMAIMCGNEDLAAAIGARRVKDDAGTMLEVFRDRARARAARRQRCGHRRRRFAGRRACGGRCVATGKRRGRGDGLYRKAARSIRRRSSRSTAAFLPTALEIEQAQSLLAAAAGHDGAFRFQDRMVDVPACAPRRADHGAGTRARRGVTFRQGERRRAGASAARDV